MKYRKIAAVIMAVVCAAGLSACGSGADNGISGNSSAAEETSTGKTDISQAVADVEAATGTPAFFAKDFGSVDVSAALSGKKVMLIAYDSTNDWCVNYVQMAQPLYEAAGADAEITYCDGTADSWIQAIQSAVNQDYDAIDLFGISDIGQVASAIDDAKSAGVYVQDIHGTDISDDSSNADVSIGCDYERAGVLMAEKVIESVGSAEDVNCLVVADVGWGADPSVREGITSTFDSYNCNYTMSDVSITDWTEGIGNAVRNAFVADPTYNAVITYYDNMCIYAVSALEELGINQDDVIVGSFNGNPNMLEYIADGRMDFDLGESTAWVACHGLDCMARYFAGQEVHNDSGFAMYFITTDNIDDYLDPKTGKASYSYDGVQDIYLNGYSQLWGIDLTNVLDGIE